MQNTARWGGLASKSALETTWGETGQPAGGTTAPAVKRKVFAAKLTLLLKAGEWGGMQTSGKSTQAEASQAAGRLGLLGLLIKGKHRYTTNTEETLNEDLRLAAKQKKPTKFCV